ncbi:MAG TPA: 6-phosphofructokinase [Fimbriimonadales bacterium]|nr:6-phosphofructokinase [Fimbriimonadales bacterium]
MERIAILTSGGDAPGMNAAIRAIVRAGLGSGVRVFGVRHGFIGLIENEIREMNSIEVGGIIGRGGTVLRTGRTERFRTEEGMSRSFENLKNCGVDGLVVIGGDGSMRGAYEFHQKYGMPVVCIPASIDNDISCTDVSIGFDTAVNTAVDAIDKIRDTAYSHDRVFVIEVMGRFNGFIAVEAGLSGGAEGIIIPEIPFDLDEICDRLRSAYERGKHSSIIVVAEGAAKAFEVGTYIKQHTGFEVRPVVLGHIQRGGSPTAFDRVIATHMGAEAVQLLLHGEHCTMVGWTANEICWIPLKQVLETPRKIDTERLLLAEVMAQ